jgi:hypothetical protein
MFTTFKIANIITHVVFIAVLIVAIYFLYGIKVEKHVVEKELNYLLATTIEPISRVYPQINTKLNVYANQMVIPKDSDSVIKEIDDHNKDLLTSTIKYLTILILIALISVCVIAWKFSRLSDGKMLSYKDFLVKLIKYNIITLIFVALVYIGFTYFIGHNYSYLDYNKLTNTGIKKLIDIRNSGTVLTKTNIKNMAQQYIP